MTGPPADGPPAPGDATVPGDAPPAPAPPILRVRGPRASTVITQRWPAYEGERFLAWQREVAALAAAYPGYQATEVYPPRAGGDQWVIIIHFDDETTLQAWLDAPERAAWLAELPEEAHGWRQQTMPTGFGTWVAQGGGRRVPHWKSFLLVLVGLYPVVMLLGYLVAPYTSPLGGALAMLVGNILSVSFLEWVGMPALNRVLAPWLRAHGAGGRTITIAGTALIVATILVMVLVFRFVGG